MNLCCLVIRPQASHVKWDVSLVIEDSFLNTRRILLSLDFSFQNYPITDIHVILSKAVELSGRR